MLISRVRRWWWKRGYRKFYDRSNGRVNPYALNAGTSERFAALVGELQAVLRPQPADTVLDVGGGNGALSGELFSGCARIVVLDYSLAGVRAGGSPRPNMLFVVGDAARPPFRDGAFSTIFSYSLLPHVGSERTAKQMLKVWDPCLRNRGVLYVGDIPDRRRFPAILRDAVGRCGSMAGFKYCAAILLNGYFSQAGLTRMLQRLGYTVHSVTQSAQRRFAHERFDLLARKGT